MSNKKYRFETLQLHVGQEQADPTTDARAVPIYQTTSYVFRNSQHAADRFALRDAGNIYGRLTNPTQEAFEKRMAALEGGVAALAVASGAAAVTYALQNVAVNGDHIIAANNLYGGTFNLIEHTLSTQGVTSTIVDPANFDEVEAAFRPNTKAIIVETFGNPNASVTNIDRISEIAHRHNTIVVVDNTFGTPYLFRPLEHGADIVVHSATKFIGGHGSSLGGVIVDGGRFDWKANADKYPTLAQPDPWLALPPSSPASAPWCCAIREPPSAPSTPGYCSRASRPSRCAWSAMSTTRCASSSISPTIPRWPR